MKKKVKEKGIYDFPQRIMLPFDYVRAIAEFEESNFMINLTDADEYDDGKIVGVYELKKVQKVVNIAPHLEDYKE